MEISHHNMMAMATRMDLVFVGLDADPVERLMGEVRAEVQRIEARLSIFRHDSVLSQINATAHRAPFVLDEEMQAIFSELDALHRQSSGYFDVAMRPLQELAMQGAAADGDAWERARQRSGWDQVRFDGEAIAFTREGMKLDLGGYGKGYAMRRLRPLLEAAGLKHALVSFGESMVYGLGTHPYGEVWRVSVPHEGPGTGPEFDLKDEALSTSGNSLNNQKKFANSGHIVNPVTGQIRRESGIVSVKDRDPVRCEVFSTALFSAGRHMSREIIRCAGGLEYRWTGMDKQEE